MSVDEAAWLPRLESMKTWDDVVALAAELYEYDGARKAGKQNKQQQNPQPGSNASKGDGAAVAACDSGNRHLLFCQRHDHDLSHRLSLSAVAASSGSGDCEYG